MIIPLYMIIVSSENTCDFEEINKYISPFTIVVYSKTGFEA